MLRSTPALRPAFLTHQAVVDSAAVFAMLVVVWTATRLVLVALAWPDLGAPPFRLLPVFARGFAVDLLLAASVGSAVLAVRALAHRGPRHPRRMRAVRAARLAILASAAMFVAIAEVLFWDEFSARFNFIAVDYLVYTTEVVGNIRESYPLATLLTVVATVGAGVALLLARSFPLQLQPAWPLRARVAVSLAAIVVAVLAGRAAIGVNDDAPTAPSLRTDVR
ncbi:MAG TPA: hypothetical protein VGE10_11615, partial [Zeimonas sp.]